VGDAHLPLAGGGVPVVGDAHLPLAEGGVPAVDGPVLGQVFGRFGELSAAGGRQERAAGGSAVGLPEGSVPALSALDAATMLRELTNLRKHVHPSEG
jgi:hypothetical protein